MTAPVKATTKPAPAFTYTSLIWIVKFSGRPSNVASSDREYWFFAIQIGRFPNPILSILASCFSAAGAYSTELAPYISFEIVSIFSFNDNSSLYSVWKLLSFFSSVSKTFSAKAIPPSPPFSHTSDRANSQPRSSQKFLMYSFSASVSVTNEFNVTTTGTPNFCTFSICFSKFTIPFFSASKFSSAKSFFATPPLYFNALTVATKTTASGFKFALLHLISMNFSAPKSAPNPASVMAISHNFNAVFVARTLLQPCAMFAKGPPCTNAGVCSNVWIKFGLIASLRRAVIAPVASNWSAVTGSPAKL